MGEGNSPLPENGSEKVMEYSIDYASKNYCEWNHFAWSVIINGVSFEYKTGLGHSTSTLDKRGFPVKKPKDKECKLVGDRWVHIPKIDDVLYCLFSDADAGSMSFDDFCSDFGYSNDSLKALDTYRACMTTAERLKKALGNEYHTEKQRIAALEL